MTRASTGPIEEVGEQLRLIGDVLWDPERAASRIREGAGMWLAAILFSAVVAVVSWLSVGPTLDVLVRDPTSGLSQEQLFQALTFIERFGTLIAVGSPLVLWIEWNVLAAVVWLTCVVADRGADHRRLLTLVVYASGVLVLKALLAFGVLLIKSPSAATVQELQPLTSLSALWPNASGVTAAVLDSTGVFEVWFLAVLAVGIRRLAEFGATGALLAVVPAWLCLVAGRAAGLLVQR